MHNSTIGPQKHCGREIIVVDMHYISRRALAALVARLCFRRKRSLSLFHERRAAIDLRACRPLAAAEDLFARELERPIGGL